MGFNKWNSLTPEQKYEFLKGSGVVSKIIEQGARLNKDGEINDFAHRPTNINTKIWIETFSALTIDKDGGITFYEPKNILGQKLNIPHGVSEELIKKFYKRRTADSELVIALNHTHLEIGGFNGFDNNASFDYKVDLFMYNYADGSFNYHRATKEMKDGRFQMLRDSYKTLDWIKY